tara:strand:+ start:251 stop:442 length:192 start_codon:yes stop_codon:yes gene_type:complete
MLVGNVLGNDKMNQPIIDQTMPLKRGRKPNFSEVEFIIPYNIQYGLVVITPHKKKHTRRPPIV